MIAKNIIDKAMALLGYADMEGNTDSARFQLTSITAVNAIYSDLYYLNNKTDFKPITSANDSVNLEERVLNDVMPYGVASFIAQNMGDTVNQQFYSQMYNLKRKSVSAQATITDTLPTVEIEGA
ncbi:MAG: hypothetical protein E7365_06025 [Clostridiales bacterium]|nr:hypothetical protein [Clostridiales bacterium]